MNDTYLSELKSQEANGLVAQQSGDFQIRIVYRGENIFYRELKNVLAAIVDIRVTVFFKIYYPLG